MLFFYKNLAAKTKDKVLKEFFDQMTIWEKQHYDDLLKISEEAEEEFWQKNRFQPF